MKQKYLFFLIIMSLILNQTYNVRAQNIAGEYQVTVEGNNFYLDITPVKKAISGTTSMKITQSDEKITVEFGTFAGAMAATIFKGKVGNNLMCAVWWYQGSAYETKVIWGEVSSDRRTINGKLIYPRVAYRDEGSPGTSRFVPGWLEVNFTARKKIVGILLKEDCISFDYRKAVVKKVGERWKIVVGNMWLKDFGIKENEARIALRIIQHYRMNNQCFVGRPDPSMEYYLVNGQSPVGSFRGEDCIGFNPDNIEVKEINGRWKIVEGSHWIMDFGSKKDEAMKAFRIINKYGFNRICFVGRPDPSLTYFRQ